ncbi:hypothetical protein EVAR_22171_1 [Eumeta japonica]|uniref:ZAD domain-containing protein n=1 Tax=Eumeta variegata TaxID=151549 RepID=A0A4C1XX86_EUMVA|nr:hypothetical protein EVAR_22171_1 [Eumeta japonica]
MAKKTKAKSKAKAAASAKTNTPTAIIREEAIAAVLSSVNQAIRSKVCRLCETKDGPFLQIFSPDKVLSKKMQELLPFVINETDGLPHKICFRCSAKVEELHEFIQKCLKTQYSLNKTYGVKDELIMKTNTRKIWEEKLNKSNMSNDDICDALIKKAMEGIKDLPSNAEISNEAEPVLKEKLQEHTEPTTSVETITSQCIEQTEKGSDNNVNLMKDVKISLNKVQNSKQNDHIPSPRTTRASKAESKNSEIKLDNMNQKPDIKSENIVNEVEIKNESEITTENVSNKQQERTTNLQMDFIDLENSSQKKAEKSFDIMDHVTSIKVNGVGFLFQCKLCNRNFLKKEVVLSHACAKTGVPKVDCFKSVVNVEQPKNPPSNIKFITRKIPDSIKEPVEVEILKKNIEIEASKEVPPPKPKPKIGPASKVKKSTNIDSLPSTSMNNIRTNPSTPSQNIPPLLQMPVHIPGMVNRFKLVPGPNNSFTLVEDVSMVDVSNAIKNPEDGLPKPSTIVDLGAKTNKKPKKSASNSNNIGNQEIIDLEDDSVPGVESSHIDNNIPSKEQVFSKEQPYPVGLFQTIPRSQPQATASFAAPAIKKQSYTVVQTGDPSKLVISTKTQSTSESRAEPTVTSKPKKNKKSKLITQNDKKEQPFNVTIEDNAPQQPFNSQLFSFVNVDPLLQPSYVLPTNNIIQESQITTSTPTNTRKDVYPCHLCTEVFKAEKKYLAHIQIHYEHLNKQSNVGVSARKRSRRS